MPPARRSTDRRRRVLYHAHTAPQIPTTEAAKRAAEELREARQPGGGFGSRVHQRLRGRWFSLVPVSRLALWSVLAVLAVVPITLTGLHHLAFNWPSLAYRAELARPLQIQRPDSIAAWWMSLLLLVIAGACWLIYVLREHRRDDYRGHYRLWRLTMIVAILASAHATIGLVAWLGAGLDLIFGDRAALSGANWLRLVLDVGGIILLMRLVVEVARCRSALMAMLGVAACFGYFEAAAWNVVLIDSPSKATIVTAAPLIGASLLLTSCTIYLRALFREVRNIGQERSIASRIAIWFRGGVETDNGLSIRRPEDDEESSRGREAKSEQRNRPIQRSVESPNQPSAQASTQRSAPSRASATETKNVQPPSEAERVKKPGFFARLRRKPPTQYAVGGSVVDEVASALPNENDESNGEPDESTPKRKRRLFGLLAAKRDPAELAEEDSANDEPKAPPVKDVSAKDGDDKRGDDKDGDNPPRKSGWLGGLFRRKPKTDDEGDAEDGSPAEREQPSKSKPAARSGPLSQSAREANRRQPIDDDAALENPDDIDWDSLSKAERRRLRKKLKRGGRAA